VSRTRISRTLRSRVAAQARARCGYCLTQEAVVGTKMEIDHIVPEARGGPTVEANLWLVCVTCNKHKRDQTVVPDPATGSVVALFDPRRQEWSEHFAWVDAGIRIEGRTAIGRATVAALQFNRPRLVRARSLWIAAGWHPPAD
jgi:hypothetical protein